MNEIGKAERLAKMAEAKTRKNDTLEERIKTRMDIAWGEWLPGYEDWLNWSNDLYTDDCTVNAIGDETQNFRDYQASMAGQRSVCDMAMGPILQQIVEGNVVALVYHMYLTPKQEGSPTFDMIVMEFNTLEEIDGKLKVTHLDLYTDGGGLNQH